MKGWSMGSAKCLVRHEGLVGGLGEVPTLMEPDGIGQVVVTFPVTTPVNCGSFATRSASEREMGQIFTRTNVTVESSTT